MEEYRHARTSWAETAIESILVAERAAEARGAEETVVPAATLKKLVSHARRKTKAQKGRGSPNTSRASKEEEDEALPYDQAEPPKRAVNVAHLALLLSVSREQVLAGIERCEYTAEKIEEAAIRHLEGRASAFGPNDRQQVVAAPTAPSGSRYDEALIADKRDEAFMKHFINSIVGE